MAGAFVASTGPDLALDFTQAVESAQDRYRSIAMPAAGTLVRPAGHPGSARSFARFFVSRSSNLRTVLDDRIIFMRKGAPTSAHRSLLRPICRGYPAEVVAEASKGLEAASRVLPEYPKPAGIQRGADGSFPGNYGMRSNSVSLESFPVSSQAAVNAQRAQLSILMVEDNPSDVELMRLALREFDIPVELQVARTGDEALQILTRCDGAPRCPDLVLLDLNLPGLTGHQVLERIKSDERTSILPVIVYSSSRHPLDVRRAYDARANAYLRKPSGVDELLETARSIYRFWTRASRVRVGGA